MTRKRLMLMLSALVLVASGLIAVRPWSGTRAALVVCSYGGSFQDAQRAAYFEPFARQSGAEVREASYSGEYGRLKAMVKTGSVEWDVVDVETSALLRGAEEGILEPIDYRVVDVAGLMAGTRHKFGVATDYFSTVLAYSRRAFSEPSRAPRSWSDFWDVEKFPGPRALRRDPRSTLEIALLADGVEMSALYPLDVDRAFASLDRVKDHVKVWWSSGHQPAQLLADGEVVMAAAWSGRIWAAAALDGQPLVIEWNQGVADPEWWVVPRGARNKDLAMRFIAFASGAENQARFTRHIAYGPTNIDAFKYIEPAAAENLTTHPPNLKKQVVMDGEWWAANETRVLERWNQWLID